IDVPGIGFNPQTVAQAQTAIPPTNPPTGPTAVPATATDTPIGVTPGTGTPTDTPTPGEPFVTLTFTPTATSTSTPTATATVPPICPPQNIADGDLAALILAINTVNDEVLCPGPDTINLAANGTYIYGSPVNGANAFPVITTDITINGNDAQIQAIAGQPGVGRMFTVDDLNLTDPAPAILTLNNLDLLDGTPGSSQNGGAILVTSTGTLNVNGGVLSGAMADNGAGIFNDGGTVTLTDATVENNTASGNGGGLANANGGTTMINASTFRANQAADGGGLYNSGTTTINASTFQANQAADGGGLYNSGGTANVFNSTFSENSVFNEGGGIFNTTGARTEVVFSTLARNAGSSGTGVTDIGGEFVFKNSIIAAQTIGNNCDIGGIVDVQGVNFTDDSTCPGFINAPNLNLDAASANNGGPTQTLALLAGSAASDAAVDCTRLDMVTAVTADQRGVARPQPAGGVCDAGAFEFESIAVGTVDLAITKTVDNATPAEGDQVTFTVTLTNNGPDAATNVVIADPLPTGLTLVNATSTLGTYNGLTGDWALNAIGIGASETLTLVANVDLGTASTMLTNTASLTAVDQMDTNPSNDSASAAVTVSPMGCFIPNPIPDGNTAAFVQAIIDANDETLCPGPDTINLAPNGSYSFTLPGVADADEALPTITSVITISGNSAIIQRSSMASLTFRLFTIANGGNLTLDGVTLSSGFIPGDNGGALNVLAGGTYVGSNVTFSNNQAFLGGAIYSAGNSQLNQQLIQNNTATDGAGIYLDGGMLNIAATTLSGNNATNDGGGLFTAFGTLVVNNSTFTGNTAVGDGGAIKNIGLDSSVTNVTISGNTGALGGGIYNTGSGQLAIAFSSLINNASSSASLEVDGGAVAIKNSIVAFEAFGLNCAVGGGTLTANGGNFDNDGFCPFTFTNTNNILLGPLAINDGGLTQTHALQPGSAPIDAATDCTLNSGLAVTNDQNGTTRPQGPFCDSGAYEAPFTGVNCNPTILSQDPNAVVAAINNANDEILCPGPNTIGLSPDDATYEFTAPEMPGGENALPIIDTEITINGNGAELLRSMTGGTPNFRIFTVASGGNLTLDNVAVNNGLVTGDGGAVNVQAGGTLTAQGGALFNDNAANNGGAIASSGTLTLANVSLNSNQATTNGGGLYRAGTSTTTITDSMFQFNTAASGGGIYLANAGGVTITRSTIDSNEATGMAGGGAGIYVTDTTPNSMTILNSTISNNDANGTGAVGGGIFNSATTGITIFNSTISGNSAAGTGGGIFNQHNMDVRFTTIFNNSAPMGGGVRTLSDTLAFTNSLVGGASTGGACSIGGTGIITATDANFDDDGTCTGFTQLTSLGLAPLSNNGGPTETHAIISASPLSDSVTMCVDLGGNPLTEDQRGPVFGPRPQPMGGNCEPGSFESPLQTLILPEAAPITPTEITPPLLPSPTLPPSVTPLAAEQAEFAAPPVEIPFEIGAPAATATIPAPTAIPASPTPAPATATPVPIEEAPGELNLPGFNDGSAATAIPPTEVVEAASCAPFTIPAADVEALIAAVAVANEPTICPGADTIMLAAASTYALAEATTAGGASTATTTRTLRITGPLTLSGDGAILSGVRFEVIGEGSLNFDGVIVTENAENSETVIGEVPGAE
ncbi:MAG: DUF11 domain-containing protein, partial [Chloroflexi bacterium]|nr:DUF11 domain-containing protein [Chloroflexota bacterium]